MKTSPGVRASERGFTLIELLIVIAILGLLASMLIPNLLDAMQKAKQKKTVADMRIVGTALFSWLTDEVGAAAAGADNTVAMESYQDHLKDIDELRALLKPRYLQEVPALDGWKFPYQYYINEVDPSAREVMMIRSRGLDNTPDADQYTLAPFSPTDYAKDIVWADGFFVRWPEGASIAAPEENP